MSRTITIVEIYVPIYVIRRLGQEDCEYEYEYLDKSGTWYNRLKECCKMGFKEAVELAKEYQKHTFILYKEK